MVKNVFQKECRGGSVGRWLRVLCLVLLFNCAFAEVPPQINFQGRLTDSSGNPLTGSNFDIKFLIYAAASGGTALWSETQTGISVSNESVA